MLGKVAGWGGGGGGGGGRRGHVHFQTLMVPKREAANLKLGFNIPWLLQAIEHAIATSGQANKRALARKHLIEKRKEEQERLLLEQEREQEEQRMIQLRISEEAEEKRRKADM